MDTPKTQLDRIVEKSKARLLIDEKARAAFVKKKLDVLSQSIERPDDDWLAFQASHTVRRQVLDFAEIELKPLLTEAMDKAIIDGYTTADELLRASLKGSPLEEAQLRNVEFLAQQIRDEALRKPLAQLTQQLPDEAAKFFRDAVLAGKEVTLDKLYDFYAKLDRTTTFSVYREAKRQVYRANSHLVKSWVWHAACDRRTCPICWDMHGSVHDLDEEMVSHGNCRCAMIPKTKTWKELGFTTVPDELESSISIPRGADLFKALDVGDQVKVLGPSAAYAYRRGDVTLGDFVGYTAPHKDTGKQYPRRKSNRELGIEKYTGGDET